MSRDVVRGLDAGFPTAGHDVITRASAAHAPRPDHRHAPRVPAGTQTRTTGISRDVVLGLDGRHVTAAASATHAPDYRHAPRAPASTQTRGTGLDGPDVAVGASAAQAPRPGDVGGLAGSRRAPRPEARS